MVLHFQYFVFLALQNCQRLANATTLGLLIFYIRVRFIQDVHPIQFQLTFDPFTPLLYFRGRSKSKHPEAILKRQRSSSSSRRKHNFASRPHLSNAPADSPPDRSYPAINTNIHPNAVPIHASVQVHELHSENVKRLDEETTAEEVVRAIKRAQNLHDLRDVKEIARFLVDEVGEQ